MVIYCKLLTTTITTASLHYCTAGVIMAPTLYSFEPSPFCRSVLLAAKALDLELDVKTVNLMEKEQMKPEFLAINPQHTVPTLVDGSLVLAER